MKTRNDKIQNDWALEKNHIIQQAKSLKVAKWRMNDEESMKNDKVCMKNDEGWKMNDKNDEGWKMNDEGWWFQAVEGFCFRTDEGTDRHLRL